MYEHLYHTLVTEDQTHHFSLPDWIAVAPFEEYLGIVIINAAEGKATLTMPFRLAHAQGVGLMHGGAIISLADTALVMAIKSILPKGSDFVTLQAMTHFHAPVTWGMVTARAEVTERTERNICGRVLIYSEEGRSVATFEATFRIRNNPFQRTEVT